MVLPPALRLWTLLVLPYILGCTEERGPAPRGGRAVTPELHAASGTRLVDLLETGGPRSDREPGGCRPEFRNVALASGVRFQRFSDAVPERYFLPEVMGGGVAWFDYDCDGCLDLYAVDGCRLWDPDPAQTQYVNRLFRSLGGKRFAETTSASRSGDNRYGQGCAAGDFDADGFPDLYVTNYGRNTLLANQGDGTFADVTTAAGVGDESWGTSAVWFDANADGDSDLYVVNYVDATRSNHRVCTYGGVEGYCGPGQWGGVDDLLYLNLGDGGFQIAAKPDSASSKDAKGLAVAVVDFDGDSRAEIYIANDMAPNFLLTRLPGPVSPGQPLYRNVADAAGCAVSGDGLNEASMGIACADFDGDGPVDIFLTHYYESKDTLYRNLGSLLFEDDSRRSRTAATGFHTLGFGTVAFDYEHDGDDDLFIANGHVLGPAHQPNEMNAQLLGNNGAGVFDDVSERIGDYFAAPCLGRGAAGGDYDNDGRVDIAVSHLDQPLAILHNETATPHHFIGLELRSLNRAHPAGGRVIVTVGERRRTVPVVGGGSYLSSSDPRLVVGLGSYAGPVDIEVVWPGRGTDVYRELEPDRYWLLREGGKEMTSPVSAGRAVSGI